MNDTSHFWILYSKEEKKAYEAGRKAACYKARSLTYGRGFRDDHIEKAFARGIEDEQLAEKSDVIFEASKWNIALEEMVTSLREIEKIGRDMPGDQGIRLRERAAQIANAISSSFIDD